MPDFLTHPALLIALGSAAGGNLRYWLGVWAARQPWAAGWPAGTFAVNVTGSLALGFVAALCLGRVAEPRRELYWLLGTGFCGGYTTFSTLELETLNLLRDGRWPAALAYVAASCALGLAAVALGATAAGWLAGRG